MVIGYIYKIYDNTNGSVYYGSTKNKISQRIALHRSEYKGWCAGKRRGCKSYDIIKNGDYAYSLVEQVEYEDKLVLHQRERWYIENNECVNKNVPARTKKEWGKKYREEHKEEIAENNKKYKEEHKEDFVEYQKKYREEHKDEIIAKKKENYQKKKAEKEASNLI